jgi:peptidyl-prolyl cis-trans isomerase A (cyclophilin A)
MIKVFILSGILFILNAANSQDFSKFGETAPDTFRVEFVTTKGSFIIEAYRNWSPKGVDRLYTLVKNNYYEGLPIYRVVKDFVAQFGLCNDYDLNEYMENNPIEDEPVKGSNLRGVISYARSGKDSRSAQLFINLKDNTRLDTVTYNNVTGFPPIGKIIEGIEVIGNFNSEYGELPSQDSIKVKGREYTERVFPRMDYINKVSLIH